VVASDLDLVEFLMSIDSNNLFDWIIFRVGLSHVQEFVQTWFGGIDKLQVYIFNGAIWSIKGADNMLRYHLKGGLGGWKHVQQESGQMIIQQPLDLQQKSFFKPNSII